MEIAFTGGLVYVRDSAAPTHAALAFSPPAWRVFCAAVRAGALDVTDMVVDVAV